MSALPARGAEAYHNANVRVGVALTRGLDLSVGGENLLRPYHFEFGPTVGIARSVYASVTWRVSPDRP